VIVRDWVFSPGSQNSKNNIKYNVLCQGQAFRAEKRMEPQELRNQLPVAKKPEGGCVVSPAGAAPGRPTAA